VEEKDGQKCVLKSATTVNENAVMKISMRMVLEQFG
jgi:hypothetical protein